MRHPSQRQINDICHAMQKQGEEVCVEKVNNLLGEGYSVVDVARKVLLFKNNYQQALRLGQQASQSADVEPPSLLERISTVLEKAQGNISESALMVKRLIDDECAEQVAKLKSLNQSLDLKVIQLDRLYLAEVKKYTELLDKYKILKDQHYALTQEHQKISSSRHSSNSQLSSQKISDFRSIEVQFEKLNASKMACYDYAKKVIVIKAPTNDALVKTLNASGGGVYLHATPQYDFKRKCWELYAFSLKTIEFLIRNDFVISAELGYVHQVLMQKSQKN